MTIIVESPLLVPRLDESERTSMQILTSASRTATVTTDPIPTGAASTAIFYVVLTAVATPNIGVQFRLREWRPDGTALQMTDDIPIRSVTSHVVMVGPSASAEGGFGYMRRALSRPLPATLDLQMVNTDGNAYTFAAWVTLGS